MRTVLKLPEFRRLFAGLVANLVADSVLVLALAIWVKDLTRSDGLAGVTLFAVAAPMALAPLVGWLVDRFPRRPFFAAVNVGAAAALLPLLLVGGAADVWVIYVVAGLYGLAGIAGNATLNALLREMLPAPLLVEANGAVQTVKQGLRMCGPLVGAGLYVAIGPWSLAVVAGTGFLVAAGAVATLPPARLRLYVPRQPLREELMAGYSHLIGRAALRRTVMGAAVAMLALGFGEALIFAYVDKGLRLTDPGFVGVLMAVQGVGGLLGGLTAPTVINRYGEIGGAALGLLLFVPATLALTVPVLPVGMVAVAVFGAGVPMAIVGITTLVQRFTPAWLLGRVTAVNDAMIMGPQAASIGIGAVLVSFVDYRVLYLGIALVVAVAGTYLWRGRRLSPPMSRLRPIDPPARPQAPAASRATAA
ncbi:MFS transporter [Pilimelia terevasa]|uniref:MFS transporter n=1 Tax=Pilimelia terevasa TaxID=53372 RepID=A0A8J3FES5_9ACTN|nr:MFS transporter [Pilimelia terevasa]GGK17049.1 MFS transporter [Pilimelia terevasa]